MHGYGKLIYGGSQFISIWEELYMINNKAKLTLLQVNPNEAHH